MPGRPDPSFPEQARPDEQTLRKVASGEIRPRPRRRRSEPRVWAPAGPLDHIKVDPAVWQVATDLADHPRNIEIRAEGEVVVWNHGPPWPRR